MSETFPFGLLSNFDLLDLYEIDLPSLLKTLPTFETQSKLTNLPNMNDFDIDENLPSSINSKYYSLNDLNKVKVTKESLSFHHTNIRSLSKHLDELHTQLSMLNTVFDVIGISESKQQVGKDQILNTQIKGYVLNVLSTI